MEKSLFIFMILSIVGLTEKSGSQLPRLRTVSELIDRVSKENRIPECNMEIKEQIQLNKYPKIGDQFIDFDMNDMNKNKVRLSDIKGEVVLLEFWAAWCGPCRKENPNLVKTYQHFNSKGFEILAVSLDEDKDSWLRAIRRDNLPWKHVSDLKGPKNEAFLVYGVKKIPDNFLIAKNGKIIGRNLRGEELNLKLKELLEE